MNGGKLDTSKCECDCPKAWGYKDCSREMICGGISCYNGGSMSTRFRSDTDLSIECWCTCRPGTYGEECELYSCGGKKCLNGGTLNTKTCACKCSKEFQGITCQTKVVDCPEGWTLKGNICYKYEATKANYATAKTLCKAAGGDIAMPKTQAELNNVIAFRNTRNSKNYMWVGIDDIKAEGHFIWNDGSSLAGGKKSHLWLEGEPTNDGGVGDCVIIWKKDKFNDVPCNTYYSRICQKALS